MANIRVRELAERCNCSVQNIYNHINKHEEELRPHIYKDRRGTFLDEYACDLIRSYMYPKEVSADIELQQQLNNVRQALLETSAKLSKVEAELAHTRSDLDIANRDLAEQQRLLAASNEYLDFQKSQNAEQLDEIKRLEEALKASETAQKAAEDRAEAAENETRRVKGSGLIDRIFRRW